MICISCKGENLTKTAEYKSWKLHRCADCGLSFWHPLVFLEDQYKADTRYVQHALGEMLSPYHYSGLERLTAIAGGLDGPLDLLEIGCGNGSFLSLVKSRLANVECNGIDLNDKGVEAARKRLGSDNVVCDSISRDNRLTSKRYDAVCFFEVLEHQTDPGEFLKRASGLLKPGGWIIGSVPNSERYLPLGKREGVDYPPHHFTWWSADSLKDFLARSGLVGAEVFQCYPWTLMILSLYVETLMLWQVKRSLKSLLIRKENISIDGGGEGVSAGATVFGWVNNGFVRFLRGLLFLPVSLPVYLMYLMDGRKGRTLLFMGKKMG